jgi:hypothetical protein
MISNTFTGHSHTAWHYDDNIARLTTGRFFLANWREEAQ